MGGTVVVFFLYQGGANAVLFFGWLGFGILSLSVSLLCVVRSLCLGVGLFGAIGPRAFFCPRSSWVGYRILRRWQHETQSVFSVWPSSPFSPFCREKSPKPQPEADLKIAIFAFSAGRRHTQIAKIAVRAS